VSFYSSENLNELKDALPVHFYSYLHVKSFVLDSMHYVFLNFVPKEVKEICVALTSIDEIRNFLW